MKSCHILGVDTSNYRTSVSVVDTEGSLVLDERQLLRVKKGERGLRQSDALFQHIENLPLMFQALQGRELNIVAVAASVSPRPIEGSYMPCFKAGHGFGKAIACAMDIPFYEFSHQEGHLEAIKHYSSLRYEESFLAWHLSGGTCELLKVSDGKIDIIGGSKDISFGQVIDRTGVLMGLAFPAGEEMDKIICNRIDGEAEHINCLKQLSRIKTDRFFFNLSGIETQCSRKVSGGDMQNKYIYDIEVSIIRELFDRISEVIIQVTKSAAKETGIKNVIFAGGVSGSRYISEKIKNEFKKTDVRIHFGRQDLSGDNAVGTALLGGKAYGDETC